MLANDFSFVLIKETVEGAFSSLRRFIRLADKSEKINKRERN